MTQAVTGKNSYTQSEVLLNSQQNSSVVGKDEFLKLLTYQLKAQNPMKPYDNQEFASQLAQFSQLEQLTDIRSLLEEQVQMNTLLTQTMSNSALPGLLGKSAKAISTKTYLNGENPATMGYTLPFQASSGILQIKDEAGNTVRNVELSGLDLTSGEHKYVWDGKDDNGNTVSEGLYSFQVNVKNSSAGSYTADTFTFGIIQAVRFKSEGTMLVIGGMEIPLENVTDVATSN